MSAVAICQHSHPTPARLPRLAARSHQSYERTIQRILNDRQGRRTWADLERLERQAETQPRARHALLRLDALHTLGQYTRREVTGSTVVSRVESACCRTQSEAWSVLLKGKSTREKLALLRHSRGRLGWHRLGLPACYGEHVQLNQSPILQRPELWNQLLEKSLRKSLGPQASDSRVLEYQRLFQAYRRLQSGKLHGKVSQRAIFFDMKQLEEEMLPEHLDKARQRVRSGLFGSQEQYLEHPQSQVRQFIGQLSVLPPTSRERHLFQELSRVAIRDPKNLRSYALLLRKEIKACPGKFSHQLRPQFEKALAQVCRQQSERSLQKRRFAQSHNVRAILSALSENSGLGDSKDDLELYRSGLTVNGTVRNYTL